MRNIRNRISAFMMGRNGFDYIAVGCIAAAAFTDMLLNLLRLYFLYFIPAALTVYAGFRVLSKNVVKRRNENYRFYGALRGFAARMAAWRGRRAQSRAYKFFRCPSCGSRLRVPRGKGRLKITCSKCGQRFDGKT